MHEVPIVRDIVKTLEEAYPESFDRIIKVQLEAGLLCSVQPILIQNAFEALMLEDKRLAEIDLEVVLLPVVAYCKRCEKDFEVKYNTFVCACGTPSNKIVQGKELRISKVEFGVI